MPPIIVLLQPRRHCHLLSLCLLFVFMGTGCCRIGLECEGMLKTPDRFFGGTACCLRLTSFTKTPLLLPDLPFELAADVVLLPLDAILYANYKINPPLNVLIKINDMDRLAKRLASGANPNAKPLPILTAQYHHNLEALRLLQEHGAQIPIAFLYTFKPSDVDSLRLVLSNGLPQGITIDQKNKALIHQWLSNNTHQGTGIENLTEIIQLLLDCGFSPNEVPEYNYPQQAALDIVEDEANFKTCDKTKLLALLKNHGAKKYNELAESNPDLPQLEMKGGAIDPLFKTVVNFLKQLPAQDFYAVTTQYPGIDAPVLVVDYKPSPSSNTRTSRLIHRRESPTAWKQEGEPFDMPACWRLVLTPPGKKVQSRLLPGMPTDCILWEEWYSLPNYEAYIEMPAMHTYDGTIPLFGRLDEILQSDISKQQFTELQKNGVHHPKLVEAYLSDTLDQRTEKGVPSSQDKKWLANAKLHASQIGIAGNWWTLTEKNYIFPRIVFSTHHEIDVSDRQKLNTLVPYPDEIMAILLPNTHYKHFENRQEEHANGKDGSAYWNWKRFEFKGKGEFYLLYGDEVSDEALDKIQKLLTTLLEEQPAKP